jgi:four helix bundle protein
MGDVGDVGDVGVGARLRLALRRWRGGPVRLSLCPIEWCILPRMGKRVEDHRELRVFRAAFAAAMAVFEITLRLPADEQFALSRQIRNSARSVCANLAEAWRKRRYPASFVSKLSDAEAEAAETQVFLDFAHRCGYLTAQDHATLNAAYDRIIAQLVRMMAAPESWAIGRASGRKAGQARPPTPTSPTSPTSDGGAPATSSPRESNRAP